MNTYYQRERAKIIVKELVREGFQDFSVPREVARMTFLDDAQQDARAEQLRQLHYCRDEVRLDHALRYMRSHGGTFEEAAQQVGIPPSQARSLRPQREAEAQLDSLLRFVREGATWEVACAQARV